MAGLIHISRRLSKTLVPHFHQRFHLTNKIVSKFPPILATNTFSTSTLKHKSPFESNLLRLITNQIDFVSDYAPLHQPEKKINAFVVEDRPGEQYVTLRGRSTVDEDIKIEATMFDGLYRNMDDDEPDCQLHISMIVDIMKAEGGDTLQVVCSAWPKRLEIQNLYVIDFGGTLTRPYTGPNFRVLDKKIQSAMYEFLNARGVNNELCSFLNRYVWNKEKAEHIQRLKLLRSYVER
ncbi:hypothetical protein QVD17_05252 [Tagetes erecta]|uniref:Mitochondrial glycoprotein n=1 Tax=Tagetes erecta TaxID=13708 RepID=A0AAD8LEP3_TARER|nr:hypothetical protein QVD17_05252 [Tagetes erecta]